MATTTSPKDIKNTYTYLVTIGKQTRKGTQKLHEFVIQTGSSQHEVVQAYGKKYEGFNVDAKLVGVVLINSVTQEVEEKKPSTVAVQHDSGYYGEGDFYRAYVENTKIKDFNKKIAPIRKIMDELQLAEKQFEVEVLAELGIKQARNFRRSMGGVYFDFKNYHFDFDRMDQLAEEKRSDG